MRARDHLYERHSVVRGHQLLAEALNQRLGYLDLADTQTLHDERLLRHRPAG